MKQILESGSPATMAIFDPSVREPAWQTFVSNVPSCTQISTSGQTLDCLRRANSSDIAQGLRSSLAAGGIGPALDGPNGLIPDYPSTLLARGQIACVPFIAGTNLDEGEPEIAPLSSEAGYVSSLIHFSGTQITYATFTTSTNSTDSTGDISDIVISLSSPPIVAPSVLEDVAKNISRLYPDIPALGSPFGTGNETFGFSSEYKQIAAIS